MQYRAIYDKSVPADPPDDFSVCAESDEVAFALIAEQWDRDGGFPLEDVTKDGESLWDEYNEWLEGQL